MRHGAEVVAVVSAAAEQLIDPTLLEWATGNPVVGRLTGRIEHILYTHPSGTPASLYLIAPCTGNTISKIACGIDDTPVTSVATAAIGERIPTLIAPAMHDSMFQNPFIRENLKKLESAGIQIIPPRAEEGKAKVAAPSTIVEAVISRLAKQDLTGLNILVTAGPTLEPIDPVRAISNRSSGKMGIAFVRMAQRRGAKVTLVYGPGQAPPPPECKTIRVETTKEMEKAVRLELKRTNYDIAVMAAAVADFAPEKRSLTKISTHTKRNLNLKLKATPKILDEVKSLSPKTLLIAFKTEHNLRDRELVTRGYLRLKKARADLIAVNDVARVGVGFGTDNNEVLLIDKKRKVLKIGPEPKDEVADRILDEAMSRMK